MDLPVKNITFLHKLIFSILSTIEASDSYTVNHQNNVSVIARMIAQTMGLSAFEVEGIRIAAQIHDVGKAAIPNELLSKYGELNAEEFQLIKTHSSRAYDILKNIEFPWPILDMVMQHHERIDGSGYPKGLTGSEICLGAKVIAVADIVDAMMNDRPYRKALGLEAVTKELTDNAQRYDPEVCEAFMQVISDGGQRLTESIYITH